MDREEWRPVAGYEGAYEVSDKGRVRSLKRRHVVILKPTLTKFGYLRVELSGRKYLVHCLVAEAFIGPKPAAQEVRHRNGDNLNCGASNLTYGTHPDNCLDMVQHGTHNWARKTHCPAGHEYIPENTRIFKQANSAGFGRNCRTCHRIKNREYARRKRAEAAA